MTKNSVKDNPLNNKGLLLINKPAGKTSHDMVDMARRRLGIRKIGHAGTLDPFATGLLILLVGREYTRLSNRLLNTEKEYVGQLRLGAATDTHDIDGKVVAESDIVPTLEEVEQVISYFQGEIEQIPPMFSAKKIKGQKLYHLARKGLAVERQPVKITLNTEVLDYQYPFLSLKVTCSKGTYVRSLAHDIGLQLNCYAHLHTLTRTRCGEWRVDDAMEGERLLDPVFPVSSMLRSSAGVG